MPTTRASSSSRPAPPPRRSFAFAPKGGTTLALAFERKQTWSEGHVQHAPTLARSSLVFAIGQAASEHSLLPGLALLVVPLPRDAVRPGTRCA